MLIQSYLRVSKIFSYSFRWRYTGDVDSASQPGRVFWDDCGRSVLESILSKQIGLTFPRLAACGECLDTCRK